MINKLNRFNNMMDRFMHTGTWCVITIAATGMCAWCLATADNGAGIALWTLMSLISLFNSALSVRNLLHGGKE